MEHQVHRADAQHGLVGIESVEHRLAEMAVIVGAEQFGAVVLLDIFRALDDKSRRTHCGVADGVAQSGLHQFDHHADDVARGTELSVIAARRHFAQNILVDVAHRVAVVHVEVVDAVHDSGKRPLGRNQENRAAHETAVRARLAAVQILDERKNIVAHGVEHRRRIGILEHMPAQ